MAWATVNLGLATVGLVNSSNNQAANHDALSTIRSQHRNETIFLVNTALDVAYVVSGLYLTELSKDPDRDQQRLDGFGNSIILQGSFLFLFDLTMYVIHKKHGKELDIILKGLTISSNGLGLRYRF